MGVLYELEFSNGKRYIGITTRTAEKRYRGHEKSVAAGSSCAVHRAWRKYGAPKLRVLAVLEDELLAETELRAIRVFGTAVPDGYNQVVSETGSPMHNPEIAAKVSKALMGHKINVGRVHTEESRRNMAAAQKALRKTISEENRARLSALMKERHRSGAMAAVYKKISEAHKGKRHSEETKRKISERQKGVPKSRASVQKRLDTLKRKKEEAAR